MLVGFSYIRPYPLLQPHYPALALLRIGRPYAKIHAMFTSIQRMIHRVHTVFSDSEMSYGGDEFKNWLYAQQGILQGNTAVPAIWSILRSFSFDIIREKGHSDSVCSAISKQLFLSLGFAYIDDCNLIQSGTAPWKWHNICKSSSNSGKISWKSQEVPST